MRDYKKSKPRTSLIAKIAYDRLRADPTIVRALNLDLSRGTSDDARDVLLDLLIYPLLTQEMIDQRRFQKELDKILDDLEKLVWIGYRLNELSTE